MDVFPLTYYLQPTMRGTFCFLLVMISLPAVRAQSWCPPGAEWHWGIFNLGVDGFVHRWYAGDTVVYGRNAQKIQEAGVVINYFSQDTTSFDVTRFTSMDGQDVLLWSERDGTWQWDTLYRFGAAPGTIWRPANGFFGGGFCLVQVADTSTTNYYGQPLKQLTLTYLEGDSTPISFGTVLTERIGAEDGTWLLPYQCVMDAEVEILRCYSDVDMSYVDPNWHYGCASWTGLAESKRPLSARLLPNPGTDHFTLDLPQSAHVVEVLDATGRCALSERSTTGTVRMSTSSLAKGIYLVRVDGTRTARWVKQ